MWATTWEHSANEAMSPVLGLGQLPVIEFDRGSGDTWKLPSVQEFVSDHAMAWVDDGLYIDAFTWAREREEPTLLIRTSSSVGMTADHFDQLLVLAKRVDSQASDRPRPDAYNAPCSFDFWGALHGLEPGHQRDADRPVCSLRRAFSRGRH